MVGIKKRISSPRFLSAVDILDDISIEMQAQKAKTLLLITAVLFSVGALVGSIGISKNAAHQIDADLAASTIRTITVSYLNTSTHETGAANSGDDNSVDEQNETNMGAPSEGEFVFPANTLERAISTVEYAGMRLELTSITSTQIERPLVHYSNDNPIIEAVSAEYFSAADIRTRGNLSLLDSSLPVAVLGVHLAETMGIPVTSDTRGLTININGVHYSIIGFVDDNGIAGKTLYIPYQ